MQLDFWEVSTGKHLRQVVGERSSIAFSFDGSCLVSTVRPDTVGVYDIAAKKEHTWQCASTWVRFNVACSPLDDTVAVARIVRRGPEILGVIELRELQSGRIRKTLNLSAFPECVTYSGDGRTLAAGTADGMIHIWDTTTWKLKTALDRKTTDAPNEKGYYRTLAISHDGTKIAATPTYEGRIIPEAWDVGSKQWRMLDVIGDARFLPDGRLAAPGGPSRPVRIIELTFDP